jgi:hypothetical protein
VDALVRSTRAGTAKGLTVRVKDLAQELHAGRRQRVVLGELELGREDAALKGRTLGALDQGLPVQQVVLGDGAGRDAVGRIVGQRAVLLEQPAVGGGLGHVGSRAMCLISRVGLRGNGVCRAL